MTDMSTPPAGSHFRLIDFSPTVTGPAHPAHATMRRRGRALMAAPRSLFAKDTTEAVSEGVDLEMETETEVEMDVVTVPTADDAYPQVHSHAQHLPSPSRLPFPLPSLLSPPSSA